MQKKFQIGQLAKKENRQCLANGLGWFSIGLGLAELLMPRQLCRMIGVKPRPFLTKLLGVREIISGVGLLTQPKKAPWLQARVAGDRGRIAEADALEDSAGRGEQDDG